VLQIVILVFALLIPVMAVLAVISMIKYWRKNAKKELREVNRKTPVRIFVMVIGTMVAMGIYTYFSMGKFPDENIVHERARSFLVEEYGDNAVLWKLRTLERKKVYDAEPPTKYYNLEYSSKVGVGQLRVDCTEYEANGTLTVRELKADR